MKTIVIDAGHGGSDYGAVLGQRYEKNDNLNMALRLGIVLNDKGFKTTYTRKADTFTPLLERSYLSNNIKADLFISIHRNASINPIESGIKIYTKLYPPSKDIDCAETVLNELNKVNAFSDIKILQADYSLLTYIRSPALFLGLGFLTNPNDNLLFDLNFYLCANAIADGILPTLN